MTRFSRASALGALFVLPMLMAVTTPAIAQVAPQPGFAKLGGFAGVTVMPSFTFDGETFDGMTAYQEIDGEELLIMKESDILGVIEGQQAAKKAA